MWRGPKQETKQKPHSVKHRWFFGKPPLQAKPDSGKTGKSYDIDTSRDTPEDDVHRPEDEPDDVTVEPSDGTNGPDNPIMSLSRNQKKKLYTNIKKNNKSVIFNSSSITLSESMEKVLNRG